MTNLQCLSIVKSEFLDTGTSSSIKKTESDCNANQMSQGKIERRLKYLIELQFDNSLFKYCITFYRTFVINFLLISEFYP
jgi:hypothetical protein